MHYWQEEKNVRRWINIKVEITQNEKSGRCLIETHEGGVVQIICADTQKRDELISLMCGNSSNGDICILDGVSTKEQIKEYRKKIDVIDLNKISSTLTVKNYIIFYLMITNMYNNNTVKQLEALLIENNKQEILDTPINELSNIDKIIVRCLLSHMKHISCLLGKSLLNELSQPQKDIFVTFLNEYFTKNHCLCLLFDEKQHKEYAFHNILIN